MDEVQCHIAAWEDRFRVFETMFVSAMADADRKRHHTAATLTLIVATSLAARVTNLANAIVILVNRQHAFAAPVVARALFEACCMPVYMRRELVGRLTAARTNDVH